MEIPSPDSFVQACIIGIGGGGCRTINYLMEKRIRGLKVIAIDTDYQTLIETKAHDRILIGDDLIRGQGAKGNPDLGRMAAEESAAKVSNLVRNIDLVFITTGLGGGTGTGAAPVIASITRNSGTLVIGLTTLPFSFEGKARAKVADLGMRQLGNKVDALVVTSADDLVLHANETESAENCFEVFAESLAHVVKGVLELLIIPGLINLDFADMRSVISGEKLASMSFGKAPLEDRANLAMNNAIDEMLGTLKLEDAENVLLSVAGDSNLSLFEVTQIVEAFQEKCNPNVNLVFGAIINPAREDLCITIFATGPNPMITSDSTVQELASSEARKGFLDKRSLNVFLCHSSGDKPVVRKLYQRLYSRQGIDPWLDEAKLLPGEHWNHEITRAVKESDAVIVCISKDSITKEGYIQKEIKRALDVADEKPEGTIFIIPLKLEACEVPERLSEWQWVNYYEEGAFDRVIQSLQKRASSLGIEVE